MFGRHNSTLRPIADTGAPRSLTNKKGISSTIFRKSRAHFTVRKLERRYGRVAAQRAYERHPRPPDPLGHCPKSSASTRLENGRASQQRLSITSEPGSTTAGLRPMPTGLAYAAELVALHPTSSWPPAARAWQHCYKQLVMTISSR
jgi:hypothetical protein